MRDDTLPFPAAERAIQRLWSEARIRFPARAASGATVELLDPGRWNRLGGPDFQGAEIRVDGRRMRGDAEIHLRASDWRAHGHHKDKAYGNVILHAVLLGKPAPVTTCHGDAPETVMLLPLLPEDLESAAEHDALLELRGRSADIARVVAEANPDLEAGLRARARERFAAKAALLASRIAADGWEATCHRATVEALGQGGNRGPMASLALRLGVQGFAASEAGDLYLGETGRWNLRGQRPMAHPHRRLGLYIELCRRRPDWVGRVRDNLPDLARGRCTRQGLLHGTLAGLLPPSLADTLAADVWLPMGGPALETAWMEWPAGLRPDGLEEARQRLGGGILPRRNWCVQGMLHALGRGGKG